MEKYFQLIKLACLLMILAVLIFCSLAFYRNLVGQPIINVKRVLPVSHEKELVIEKTKNVQEQIKMIFLGDVMLDRHVKERIEQKGLIYIFDNLVKEKFFNQQDVVSCNLEGAVTDNGKYYPPNIENDFAFDPEAIKQLKNYNFNFFNLANNHLTDQGERGIKETRENLKKIGFNFAGCSDGRVGECSSEIFEIRGKKLGLVGLSMVYQKFDMEKAEQIIADLEKGVDLTIVNIHWGAEYQHQFNKTQQAVARSLIDAGADIIIGHHLHVVQGVEIYDRRSAINDAQQDENKGIIFYSLGNFIFDQYFSQDTQKELAVGINWTAKKVEIDLLPMKSAGSQPYLMTGEEKEEFLENLAEWSLIEDDYKIQIRAGKVRIVTF